MSIKLQSEVKALQERIENLERKMNILSPEKRTIAGTPEPERFDSSPKRSRKGK